MGLLWLTSQAVRLDAASFAPGGTEPRPREASALVSVIKWPGGKSSHCG